MNILVTGGAGYKGSLLVDTLLRLNHRVCVIDTFMFGCSAVAHFAGNLNVTWVRKDIRSLVPDDVSDADVIFHLAGISGVDACMENPLEAYSINVEGTKKLISCLRKEQKLIYASTTSFYGASGELFTEDDLVHPVSTYGVTKYEGECIVMKQHENSVALRFATVFGLSTRMRDELLVNTFVKDAVHKGTIVVLDGFRKRTFIHISDAVSAYVFAMNHFDEMKGLVFNVGDESLNLSKHAIAFQIKEKVACEIDEKPDLCGDTRNFAVSFDRINKLGYKVNRTLEFGIDELIKWYRLTGEKI
jgi:nucleoside-diphosphate-sugar epimerase